jgi:hypothetical protein
MTSVVKRPITDSARALSSESLRLPPDGWIPASAQPLGVPNRQVLRPAVAVMHHVDDRVTADLAPSW